MTHCGKQTPLPTVLGKRSRVSHIPTSPHPESKVMRKAKRDPLREDRIHDEAVVDARPEEQAMSWYYYLESKICFPVNDFLTEEQEAAILEEVGEE